MTPENSIPNNMGLSPTSSANIMGSMGDAVSSAMSPPDAATNPAQDGITKAATQFKGAWSQLEALNGSFGGDSDKFRVAQKALEDWFSSLNFDNSQTSGYQG